MLLQVDRLPHLEGGGDPHAGGEVYARFRAESERSYARIRRAAGKFFTRLTGATPGAFRQTHQG